MSVFDINTKKSAHFKISRKRVLMSQLLTVISVLLHVNRSLFLASGHQGIFLLFSQNLSSVMQKEFPINKTKASGRSGP